MPVFKEQFVVDAAGTKRFGILTVPDVLEKNIACLVCNHGVGETGTTLADLDKLYRNGLPLNVGSAVHPVTGEKWSFITLALQDKDYSPSPEQSAYVVRNIVLKRYSQINMNAIFATGLSAGGAQSLKALSTKGIFELYSSGVSMSPSEPIVNNFEAMKAQKMLILGFHGDTDTVGPHDKWKSISSADGYNSVAPGYYDLILYPGGHCCWDSLYNPAYKVDVIDKNTKEAFHVNIYEWLLLTKRDEPFQPMVQTQPTPPTQNANAGGPYNQKVNDIFQLNGSGPAGSCRWEFYTDSTKKNYVPAGVLLINGTGQNSLTPTVKFLQTGNFVGTLTIWPSGGGTFTSDAAINITNGSTPTPPTEYTKTAAFEYYLSGDMVVRYTTDGIIAYFDAAMTQVKEYRLKDGTVVNFRSF